MQVEIESWLLSANDWVPNHPRLPVLFYRNAIAADGGDLGDTIARTFDGHQWPPQWRDGVFDYHHYHSTAHEALGVARGRASLIIGGPGGPVLQLGPGDVLVLPAGTGHCCQHAEDGFTVVGAYPRGQQWDVRTQALSDAELRKMLGLAVPDTDPVSGGEGTLVRTWKRETRPAI